MNAKKNAPPDIALEQISAAPTGRLGHWSIAWRVKNLAAHRVRLLAARLPHGQFKSAKLKFEPSLDLAPGEQRDFAVLVRCDEPPGLVTENAFVIFYAVWFNQSWRIFVRLRVVVDSKRVPGTAVELITTQHAGFSGVPA